MPRRREHTARGKAPPRKDLFLRYWHTRDPAVREELVLAYGGLASYLARKFGYRGEPLEDLQQVAQVGLLNAIDRFDPTRGMEFSTYATETIVGEIKRHFRDKTWMVHVPRRLRELNNSLMRVVDTLTTRLGRSPTIAEIAEHAGVSFEDTVEALEVGRAYNPVSLDAEVGGAEEDAAALRDQVGVQDPALATLEDRSTVEQALQRLPQREQSVLRMRFYQELSQAEVARRLGISQMHVSRLQRDALQRMRALVGRIDGGDPGS